MNDAAPAAEAAPSVSTEIAAYSPLASSIAAMLAKHQGVVHDVTTTKGIEAARKDRAELRTLRVNLEDARKREKAASLEYGRKVDAEAKRLTGLIEPLENGYDEQIKAEEERKAREKQERDEAERKRVNGIRQLIDALRSYATNAVGKPSATIAAMMEAARNDDPMHHVDAYQEFAQEAKQVFAATLEVMQELLHKAEDREAEEARLVEERAELDRRRAELAQEEKRLRDIREADERAERERREAEQKQQREAQEAEQKRLKEESDRLERQRQEQEKAARELKEQQEAVAKQQREADEERARLTREEEQRKQREKEETERKAREKKEKAARDARQKLIAAADPMAMVERIEAVCGRLDGADGLASEVRAIITEWRAALGKLNDGLHDGAQS